MKKSSEELEWCLVRERIFVPPREGWRKWSGVRLGDFLEEADLSG